MDGDPYGQLRDEIQTLVLLRSEALERVEAGDEAAAPWVRAVGELIIDRDRKLSALSDPIGRASD